MSGRPEEVLYVSTTPGLEPFLEQEARSLGLHPELEQGGLQVRGPPGLHQRLNLCLRTASRVWMRLAHFRAADSRALQRQLSALSLERFRQTAPFRVRAVSHQSRLGNTSALEAVAKGAWKLPAPVTGDAAAQEVLIRVEGEECTVSVDTSGALLYLRGYRQEIGRAPLRETLAAGLLRAAGYSGEQPLWDPMCGSGTLVIEAALMAARQPPGAMRSFAFQSWPQHDEAKFEALKESLLSSRRRPPQPIWATDLNAGALGTTRRNAKRAGSSEHLTLERHDATRVAPPAGLAPGLVVCNLPYGKRVGERSQLSTLYRALGSNLQRSFPGWRYALLVADERAPEWLELSPSRVWALDNGGIACQLLIGGG